MKKYNLESMTRGWFIGSFEPSILKTSQYEVGIKIYKAGDKEESHHHKLAQEITTIISGKVEMNGVQYNAGDIVVIEKDESTDFVVLEDTVTCVVKTGSFAGDKYIDSEQKSEIAILSVSDFDDLDWDEIEDLIDSGFSREEAIKEIRMFKDLEIGNKI